MALHETSVRCTEVWDLLARYACFQQQQQLFCRCDMYNFKMRSTNISSCLVGSRHAISKRQFKISAHFRCPGFSVAVEAAGTQNPGGNMGGAGDGRRGRGQEGRRAGGQWGSRAVGR